MTAGPPHPPSFTPRRPRPSKRPSASALTCLSVSTPASKRLAAPPGARWSVKFRTLSSAAPPSLKPRPASPANEQNHKCGFVVCRCFLRDFRPQRLGALQNARKGSAALQRELTATDDPKHFP